MFTRFTTFNLKSEQKSSLDENFGLTKEEFVKFSSNVKDGDDSLFLKIFNEYLKSSIIYLKNKYGATQDHAHDICMDTMLEFRNKLVQGKIRYGNLRYLFTRMAINNYIDKSKKEKKIDNAIKVFLGEYETIPDEQTFFILLEKAIEEMDQETQHLINQLYYSGKDQSQIADENNISYSALRKRKQRILEKLRSSFFNNLKNNTQYGNQ